MITFGSKKRNDLESSKRILHIETHRTTENLHWKENI